MNFMGKKNGKVGTRSKWALKSKLKSLNFILVTMGSPWGFLSKVCILLKATWSLSDSLSSSVCDSLGNVIVIKKKKPLKDILSLSSLVIFHANQISESILCVCVPHFSRCLTLCDPVDCSPPGSSVHRISQAKILEWVATSFSRGSSWPRNWTWVSGIAGRFFTIWATRYRSIKTPSKKVCALGVSPLSFSLL